MDIISISWVSAIHIETIYDNITMFYLRYTNTNKVKYILKRKKQKFSPMTFYRKRNGIELISYPLSIYNIIFINDAKVRSYTL